MNKYKFRYTKEQMIEALQKAYQEIGDGGKLSHFFKHSNPSRNAIKRKFGSWNKALEEAGIPITKRQSIPKQEIIDDVKRVADLLSKSPSVLDYDEYGKFSFRTVMNHNFNEILQELGLKVHKNVPKEQVIQELKDVAQELGFTPSVEEFVAHPKGSNNWQVYKHYKEYKDLLDEAGLEPKEWNPGSKPRYTKVELLEKLKDIAKDLKRSPTIVEWYNLSGIAPDTIKRYFGSYKNFLKIAGLRIFRYYQCNDGHVVQSYLEREVDNFLSGNSIQHQIQVKVTPSRQWTCDFVVGSLWIEVDGMNGRKRANQKGFDEKIQFYKDNSYNYIVIIKDMNWQSILIEKVLNCEL